MQKNGILIRLISCALTLAMLFGMVPMGAVRPVEAATLEYIVIDNSAVGLYRQMGATEINERYLDKDSGQIHVFAFGDYVVSSATTEGLSLTLDAAQQLQSSNLYTFSENNYCKWHIQTGDWGGGYYQTIVHSWEDGYSLGVDANKLPCLSGSSLWGLVDNSAADSCAMALVYIVDNTPWVAYQENGSVSVKQTDWNGYVTGGEETYFYVYTPVTTVYAALDAVDYSVAANSISTEDLLVQIKNNSKVNISGDSNGTDAASYDLNTTSVGNYNITTSWGGKELNTTVAGTYTMTVSANNVPLGTVTVEVTAPASPYAVTVGSVGALNIGKTATASAMLTNNGQAVAEGYTIVWSSNNEAVATVDSSGLITAVAPGTATITAAATITADGIQVSGSTTVTVNTPAITLDHTSLSLEIGGTANLTATKANAPEDAYITWSCSPEGVVTLAAPSDVQADSVAVTATAAGSTTITATMKDRDHQPLATATTTVTVIDPSESGVPTLVIDPSPLSMQFGTEKTVTATIKDANGNVVSSDGYTITWKITNDWNVFNFGEWDKTGASVTAHSGYQEVKNLQVTVVLSKNYEELYSTTLYVNILEALYSVSVVPEVMTLEVLGDNRVATVEATITDANGSSVSESVTWTSSNPDVATVDAAGNIVAIKPGETTITATYEGVSDTVKVKVNEPTVTITLPEPITVNKGSTATVEPTVTVSVGTQTIPNAEATIEWTTDDEKFATVDSDGVLTGVAKGSTTVNARVTKLKIGDITFDVYSSEPAQAAVEVTEDPVVGFDYSKMPESIVLDVKEDNEIKIPLQFFYAGIDNPSAVKVSCRVVGLENAGTTIAAEIDEETNVLTITAGGKCSGTFSVQITGVDVEGVKIDSQCQTYHINFTVNDNSNATGELTLAGDSMTVVCNQTAPALGAVSLMHGTYEVKEYKLSYEVTDVKKNFTVDNATGEITAGDEEVSGVVVTVTATYKYGDEDKTATATFTVNSVKYVSPYSIDIGTSFTAEQNNVIPAGISFTIVPNVGVKDWLDSYTIQWSVVNETPVTEGQSVVTLVQDTTYGGPLAVGANGIQSIGNGAVTIQTNNPGTAKLVATLVGVNDEPVYGVYDEIMITVVAADADQKLDETVMYDRDEKLYDRVGTQNTETKEYSYPEQTDHYEFRIKDAHTFLPEGYTDASDLEDISYVPGGYGLDARIIAVQGDRRIDFSQVTLNLYKNGELALDTNGNPIEIPASELSYYDVDTDQVGWVKVRVTYKDYYKGHIASGKADFTMYEEYTTGEDGTDGYVWMYVREPYEVSEEANGVVYDQSSKFYPLYTEPAVETGEYVIAGIVDGSYAAMSHGAWDLSPKQGMQMDSANFLSPVDNNVVWTVEKLGDSYVIKNQNYSNENYLMTGENAGSNASLGTKVDVSKALKFSISPKEGIAGGYTFTVVDDNGNPTGQYLACGERDYGNYTSIESYLSEDPNTVVYLFDEFMPSDPAKVNVTVSNIRSWMGVDTKLSVENQAWWPILKETRDAMEGVDGFSWNNIFSYFAVDMTVSYDGNTYGFAQRDGNGELEPQWRWMTSGALVDSDTMDQYGNVVNTVNHVTEITTDTASTIGTLPALGMLRLELYAVYIKDLDKTVELDTPLVIEVPIGVREDSAGKDKNQVTFGYTPQWGGSEGFAYGSFLGGVDISAYAISYLGDLDPTMYEIGIEVVPAPTIGSGSWHEFFAVNAPMGTAAVTSHFHSYTLSSGIVMIMEPAEREGKSAEYTIELNPQMLILSAAGETMEGVSNNGTVVATVRDKEGNLIGSDVNVEVQWTIRNAAIAQTSVINDTEEMDQSARGTFTGPHSGPVNVNGKTEGVTYLTVQLMKVNGEDVSGDLIADYSIIYVIKDTYKGVMPVVVDYDKQIHIDISDFVNAENEDGGEYDFIGFTDLEHSLRQHAYTEYGEIEITEDKMVYFTPSEFIEGVDDVYVIFQYVAPGGKYYWHHYLINIIPATVMYYETDGTVADEFSYNGDWTNTGSDVSVAAEGGSYDEVQDDYKSDKDGGNQVYGYDSSYDNDKYLSNSTSVYVEGKSTADGVKNNEPETSASFTFTGTGFDLIARTDMDQATLRVHVTKRGSSEPTKVISVICKGKNELYQIPVISVKNLSQEPATYDVEIIVYDSYTPDKNLGLPEEVVNQLSRGNQFYFDAIRIYDPVKGDDTAEAAYKIDGEGAQIIAQIGTELVDAETFQKLGVTEQGEGAVFMDSYTIGGEDASAEVKEGFVITDNVQTYRDVGPNNEVYLGKGQAIAFILNANGKIPASIQIGAKSIQGDIVTLNAKILSATAGTSDGAETVATEASRTETISTSTAMYYEVASGSTLSALFGENGQVYVVIWNNGDNVLSVTDIKIAYGEDVPGAAEFLYSADLAQAAAIAIYSSDTQNKLVKKTDGWYYCDADGNVVESFSGLAVTEDAGTWYVENGKVDFNYTGLYTAEGKRYSVRSGCVETELNGIAKRGDAWLYFKEGMVDTTVNGLRAYGEEQWYIVNGVVQVDMSGIVTVDGVEYTLDKGKVVPGTNS